MVFAGVVAALVAGPVWGLPASAAVAVSGRFVRSRRRRSRRRERIESMPIALRALADLLTGGATLEQAASRVGPGNGAAAADLSRFAAVRAGGADLAGALRQLDSEAGDPIWAEVAAAIALNRRCGGDLPRALRSIADAFDASAAVRDDARSSTAQARLTARIVWGLPVFALVCAQFVWPDLAGRIIATPASLALAVAGAILQGASAIAIRAIVRSAAG